MKIAIIGTGYIGLVTGVGLAQIGHVVTCVDHNPAKIAMLQSGGLSIYEPELPQLLRNVITQGRLNFTTDSQNACRESDVIFLAINIPNSAETGLVDLTGLYAVIDEIAAIRNGHKTIVVKSTVLPGTCRLIEEKLHTLCAPESFDVVSNPEFLREGAAVSDFMAPDRIVVGAVNERAFLMMRNLYKHFDDAGVSFVQTSWENAELIKFASNAFLACKIAFVNELAEYCEKADAQINDVAHGMGLDHRIGTKFLQSGPGFGGSCFPKDLRSLVAFGRSFEVSLPIANAVIASNEKAKKRAIKTIFDLFQGNLSDKKIAVFGVTFKPDTDDMREAASLTILPALQAQGAELYVCDPEGRRYGEDLLPDLKWCQDPYEAAAGSDMIVILTEWSVFRDLDLAKLAKHMRQAILVDFRHVYDGHNVLEAGFKIHYALGAPTRFASAN